jgi:hypothetical protein
LKVSVRDGRQHDADDAYVSKTVADGNRECSGTVGMHKERENVRYGGRALHDFAGAWRRAASRGELQDLRCGRKHIRNSRNG